jgi:hypothetical protein
MSVTASKGSRLRKAECTACGCIVRMSRAAMSRSGVPFCGCGAGRLLVSELEDAARVLPDEQLYEHPGFREWGAAEHRRAIREARKAGERMHCGGCHAFIPASNHACRCGFANDIRSGRNLGGWVSGASYCSEWKAEQEWPF